MNADSLMAQVGFALAGGIAAELLHWYGLARRPDALPKYAGRPLYWITTLALIILGGAMPLLYVEDVASALLCFHLGAATPIILQKLIAAPPEQAVRQGADGGSLRDFFRW